MKLLAVAAAGGDPLTPFVVGEEGGGNDQQGENAEENLHDLFRIAWHGRGVVQISTPRANCLAEAGALILCGTSAANQAYALYTFHSFL
jgi:hypothetical protein